MKKLLLLTLLASTPIFAQEQIPLQQGAFDIAELDNCVNAAMNYSLFVYIAHNAPSRAAYNKFVEAQVAASRDPGTDGPAIRKYASEAWEERNSPPPRAGMDLYHQCEQTVVLTHLPHRPRAQSWDQENLHNLGTHEDGKDPCLAQYNAPNGNLRQCDPDF